MTALRKSFKMEPSLASTKLRNSVNFLHCQLIRSSLTRNSSMGGLRHTSALNLKNNNRVTSLHKRPQQQLRQGTDRQPAYNNLKQTLQQLQQKIGKAKRILKNAKKTVNERMKSGLGGEEESEISELESTILKKNEDIGFDITQNSTKFLSFSKSDSNNSHPYNIKCSKSHSLRKTKNYYVQDIEKLFNGHQNQRLQEHLLFSIKIFKSMMKISAPDFQAIEQQKICLPQHPKHIGKKTLLLDIDQTILHCEEAPDPKQKYDLILDIEVSDNEMATAYISLRPYALTFLRNMSKIFEIVAFTASHESYADVVLNEIDPEGQIFTHRLYRDSCQQITQNLYTKDLRIVNRRLEKTVLVDNSPYSYIFQLQNGIPILPYHNGEDRELPELQKYLKKISECNDVRQLNKQTFKLHKYIEYEDLESLEKLYLDIRK